MSHQISARVAVTGDSPAPRAEMSGTDHDIPIVTISDDPYASSEVTVALYNHNEPAEYLRAWAANLLDLAEQVEVQQAQAGQAVGA